MKHKWIKFFIITVSALCALVVLFELALPLYLKNQIKNLTSVSFDDFHYQNLTDEQRSALVENMNVSKWKRVFKRNPLDYDAAPQIYMTADDRYLLSFTSYGEFGDVVISLTNSKLPLGCIFRIESEDYSEFENFYKTTIKE